jgi:hypothetical protein
VQNPLANVEAFVHVLAWICDLGLAH